MTDTATYAIATRYIHVWAMEPKPGKKPEISVVNLLTTMYHTILGT
jgi:hypothetical protein